MSGLGFSAIPPMAASGILEPSALALMRIAFTKKIECQPNYLIIMQIDDIVTMGRSVRVQAGAKSKAGRI